MFLLLRIFRVHAGRAFWLVVSWVTGSALIAGIASQYGPVSLLIFFPVWVGFAIPAGFFVSMMSPTAPKASPASPS